MSAAIHTVRFPSEQEVLPIPRSGYFISTVPLRRPGQPWVTGSGADLDLCPAGFLSPLISAKLSFLSLPPAQPSISFPPRSAFGVLCHGPVLFPSQRLSLFEIILFLYWPVECLSLLPLERKPHEDRSQAGLSSLLLFSVAQRAVPGLWGVLRKVTE